MVASTLPLRQLACLKKILIFLSTSLEIRS
jgi:hypothetical protein